MTSTTPRKHARNAALLLSAALLLVACGGSSDSDNSTTPPPTGGTVVPPVASTDTFFEIVLARVKALLDNDEPIQIENFTVTAPETTEPEPVPSN
ncbi:hypothetical protein [Massilia sp. H6]|uniref:hypothetical protein n=1 Tax=Massilia sp. H6 TaxID=2970464 RepID=UPI002168D995|nr:hypothetical protein [Massilia sp. H6]UVW28083.1 hypothetical protein NRS07_16320 [Massilia sp. H6]